MGFLFNRGKNKFPPNAKFRLSQQGTEELSKFNGSPESRILVCLETEGTSNLDGICQATQMSKGQVERALPKLIGSGDIVVTGVGADEE